MQVGVVEEHTVDCVTIRTRNLRTCIDISEIFIQELKRMFDGTLKIRPSLTYDSSQVATCSLHPWPQPGFICSTGDSQRMHFPIDSSVEKLTFFEK